MDRVELPEGKTARQRLLAAAALLVVACLWRVLVPAMQAWANGQLEATGVIYVEETRIASELQGQVTHVLVKAGDAVQPGQDLILLGNKSLQSSVQEARTALDTAKAKLAVVCAGPRVEVVAAKQAQVAMAQAERSRASASYQAALRALDDPQALRQQMLEAGAQVSLAAAAVDAADAERALLRYQADQADWNSTERHILEQEAKAAEAELAAARADLRTAETALLHLQGMASNPLEYLAATHESEGAYRIADAGVRVSQAELRDLIQGATAEELALAQGEVALAEAKLHLAELRAQRLTVCSPVKGTATSRIVSLGETALPGATLLTIADLQEVYLVVYLPQTALSRVFVGQKVEVAVDSFPMRRFGGSVTHIASEGQYTPRNIASKEQRVTTVYEVTIQLPNPEGLLKPGMAADATFS
jgi:HlyD family secretion protein